MPQDVWTPMITSDHSLRNKSMRARNKVAHVELLRGLVLRYAVTVIYRNQQRKKKKISCPPEKRAKPKITTTFGKSLFLIKCKKQKRISVLRKKRAKPKTKINNDDFQKVVIYNKMHEIKIIFCFPGKKAKPKTKKIMTTFGKSLFLKKNARKNNFCPPKKRAKPKQK